MLGLAGVVLVLVLSLAGVVLVMVLSLAGVVLAMVLALAGVACLSKTLFAVLVPYACPPGGEQLYGEGIPTLDSTSQPHPPPPPPPDSRPIFPSYPNPHKCHHQNFCC